MFVFRGRHRAAGAVRADRVFAPLVGVVGCLRRRRRLNLIAMPELSAPGVLLLIEARTMRIREINIPRDKQCAVCGGG